MATKALSKKAKARGAKAIQKKAKALQTLSIEYVDTESLKPNTYNPNRQSEQDYKLLLLSIEEDGFTTPVVANRDRVIVDGEHRWRAGRELGFTRIPVVFVDMSAEQMRMSTLRHNRARGVEDHDLATQLLRDLRELGALDWAKDSLMISEEELTKLINDIPAPEDLAAAEFSEAWTPTKNDATAGKTEGARIDFTPEAVEKQKKYAATVQGAETAQERYALEMANRKTSYRVFVTFTDKDAELVRQTLEPNPAVKLFELCLLEKQTHEPST